MSRILVEKLINEAIDTGGTYVEIVVGSGNIAFTSDCGKRRSTKNYKLDKNGIRQIEKDLKKLDDRSVLFTGKLKRINYVLSDGRNAEFSRNDNDMFCTVSGKRYTESKAKEYQWVKFISENDAKCGLAFALKKIRDKEHIIGCKGSILRGAFDSDVSTDLQFVISGDFHGNNGFDDLEYINQNRKASVSVGRVLETAISSMLHLRLLDMNLFSVLPSTLDEDTDINTVLIKATQKAFINRPVFRTRKGVIVGKDKVMFGTDDVTSLFPQELVEQFFPGKYWIEKCTEGSREEYFLIDLGVPQYDREKFLWNLFMDDNLDELSEVLQNQKDKWLRQFYIFCSEPIAEERIRRRVNTALKNLKSIRDSKGKMQYPKDIHVLTGGEIITSRSVVVNPILIYPGGKEDGYSNQIMSFFSDELGIKGFSTDLDMKKLADDMMHKKQPVDRLYCERLVAIAKYSADNSKEADFSQYAIFPYESKRGISKAKASELVIGKPYIKEGNLLVSAMNRYPLWQGLSKLISNDELSLVIDFATKNGAIGKPVIIKQSAVDNLDFSKTLYAPGKQGLRDTDFDYTIPGLEEILRKRSIQLIRMVWTAINEVDNPDEVLFAEYSVDNRRVVNRDDSNLIKILRTRTWVPGKDGKLYMPENIAVSDISDELSYNRRNPILKQLHFGSGIKEKEKKLESMRKIAEKEGLHLISEDEYKEFLKWKKTKNKT